MTPSGSESVVRSEQAPDVHALIDRWDRSGLLEPGQAERLRADLADHPPRVRPRATPLDSPEASASEGPGRTTNGLLETAVAAGLEALGYLGAALVVGAVTYLADVPNWPRPGLLALLAAVTVGCGWAVDRLTPAQEGLTSRLVTVVGSAGLFALVGFLAMLFEPFCDGSSCGWLQERVFVFAVVLPPAAAAAELYRRETNAVTHAWFGIGVASILYLLSQVPFPADSTSYRSQEIAAALVLLPASIAWAWASETERLAPTWIGTIAASGVALSSMVMLADIDLFGSDANGLVPLAVLVFGGAYVSLGATVGRWRLTVIGALVLVWGVPWTLTDVLGLSATTTSILLLPVGLALMAYVARRLTRR